MNINYINKYNKYKTKYIKYKNQHGGKLNNEIFYINIHNYIENVLELSKKITIIIEYIEHIKYTNMYYYIPFEIIENIKKFIIICNNYKNNTPNLIKIFNVYQYITFIKSTIEYIDNIKNILDLFNIVIFILLNNRYNYKPLEDIITQFIITIYTKILNNINMYFNDKNYEIVDLINYTISNIDIILKVEYLILLVPTKIKSLNKNINYLLEMFKTTSLPSNLEFIKYKLNKLGIKITIPIINNSYNNINKTINLNKLINKVLINTDSYYNTTNTTTHNILVINIYSYKILYESINTLVINILIYTIKHYTNAIFNEINNKFNVILNLLIKYITNITNILKCDSNIINELLFNISKFSLTDMSDIQLFLDKSNNLYRLNYNNKIIIMQCQNNLREKQEQEKKNIQEIYIRIRDKQRNSKETKLQLIDQQISQYIQKSDCKKLTLQDTLIVKLQIELLKQEKKELMVFNI